MGDGIFGDIWDGIKSGSKWAYKNVLKPTGKFIKDNKILS